MSCRLLLCVCVCVCVDVFLFVVLCTSCVVCVTVHVHEICPTANAALLTLIDQRVDQSFYTDLRTVSDEVWSVLQAHQPASLSLPQEIQ